MKPVAIAVVDANFTWTRDLFGQLPPRARLLFLRPYDYRGARRLGWRWSNFFARSTLAGGLEEQRCVYPPGWFLRWPAPFRADLARRIRRWWPPGARRILVTSYPNYHPLFSSTRPDLTVYYWSDEFRRYWGADQDPALARRIVRLERQAVERADLTICASNEKARQLEAEVPSAAGRIEVLVHGHHASLDGPLPPAPVDLADAARPVLGHWGQLSSHSDMRLLLAVADAFPRCTLALVGPVRDDFEGDQRVAHAELLRRPNVRFLGSRPYHEVAAYLSAFDVGLCVYRPDLEFTKVTNPSKIRDYLAAGLAVVSTPVPDAQRYWKTLIRLATTPDGFVDAVRGALAEDGPKRGQRLEYARDHTWPKIAERLWRHLAAAGEARRR